MIFAPLLILTGIAGFVVPAQYSLMSNATPYNLFHIIFGAIGLVLLQTKNDLAASAFNLGSLSQASVVTGFVNGRRRPPSVKTFRQDYRIDKIVRKEE